MSKIDEQVSEGSLATPRRRQRRPKPVSESLRQFYTRREMLTVVPLSMSTVDTLEKSGIFPRRIVMSPTTRVAWRRDEIEQFLEDRASNRAKRGFTK